MRIVVSALGLAFGLSFQASFAQDCIDPNAHLGWSQPTNLGAPVSSCECSEKGPDESDDGLELYFSREPCGSGGGSIPDSGLRVARRAAVGQPWQTPCEGN